MLKELKKELRPKPRKPWMPHPGGNSSIDRIRRAALEGDKEIGRERLADIKRRSEVRVYNKKPTIRTFFKSHISTFDTRPYPRGPKPQLEMRAAPQTFKEWDAVRRVTSPFRSNK